MSAVAPCQPDSGRVRDLGGGAHGGEAVDRPGVQDRARLGVGAHHLNDAGCLRPRIRSDGSKHWRLENALGGRESMRGLGVYPDVALEQARDRTLEARGEPGEGMSRSIRRRVREAHSAGAGKATFEAVATERPARRRAGRSAVHRERLDAMLRPMVVPKLDALPVSGIGAAALLAAGFKRCCDGSAKEAAR